MTLDEAKTKLKDKIIEEQNDYDFYKNMVKVARDNNHDNYAQILNDIAHEEELHARHINDILLDMKAHCNDTQINDDTIEDETSDDNEKDNG